MAYLDRNRAQSLMAEANLDALIVLSPESFSYASGAQAGVATMWRSAGAVAVLIPADQHEPEMAVVSDLFAAKFKCESHITDVRESPIWVETTTLDLIDNSMPATELVAQAWDRAGRYPQFNRPATFDPAICYRLLYDALLERGLARGRIGFEGAALTVPEYTVFKSTLPDVSLIDASEVIAKLKMVKTSQEISNLRQAVELAEVGIAKVRDSIEKGVTRSELAAHWQTAIENARGAILLTGAWEYISVGADPWGGDKAIESGDLIKVDVGCLVNGYTSDTGRTFVFDQVNTLQSDLFNALMAGFEAGSALLKPGVALCEVHAVTLRAIRAAGFPGYTRGHFGHGLGAGLGSEQWPFISADTKLLFEPGMVMAFECPWYINGLGGMIVENQLLITEHGHEMMNTLPLALSVIRP